MSVLKSPQLFLNSGRLQNVQGAIQAKLKAAVGELAEVHQQDGQVIRGEVIGFTDDLVQLMLLGSDHRLQKNDLVVGLGHRMRIPVGDALLGRVVDATGVPIDGQGELVTDQFSEIKTSVPSPMERCDITEPFETGIRAIDGLLTLGRGQRVGLFAGSGVGKSTLLGDIARNAESEVNVVAMIGERGREVRPFIEKSLGTEGLKKSIVIVSTSDQSPLARVRASETAVCMASWFRNQGKNVLLMLDSLTRLATAQRELGLMLGEPPTSRGYTPSVFQKMASLLEQLGTSGNGSITGLLTVLVDGDDMNEPVADSARSILDGHVVLSRLLAERNHFPAIDVLASKSRLARDITSHDHQKWAGSVTKAMAMYNQVEDLVQIGAYRPGNMPETDNVIAQLPKINQFLQQELGQPISFENTSRQLRELSVMCDPSSGKVAG